MKAWRWLLLLLAVATLAAFGWHWLAADPGYLLLRMRGWRIETSVVVAVIALFVIWALAGIAWRLLRWPFGALARRHRRVSRVRLTQGLIALYEGRHGDAERALRRAARHGPQRALALLATADAARRRGDADEALATLDAASSEAPMAARILRARTLRGSARAADAWHLLAPDAQADRLTPAGWREYAEAALAAGEGASARRALEPLRKRGVLDARVYADLEQRVLRAALDAAADGDALATLWRGLSRAQRNDPILIDAYARRAATSGGVLAAMDELESALRRQWDGVLVDTYADLAADHPEQRLRQAETWLAAHADDARLNAAIGRMCARLRLWGKARQHLERALALDPQLAGVWRSLGDVALGEGDAARAAECYRHELDRGPASADAPPAAAPEGNLPAVLEERNEHGFPRLPVSRLEVDDEGA